MNWRVTLDFKAGPSYGPVPVTADSARAAIVQAKREAQFSGFEAPVKKAKAVKA